MLVLDVSAVVPHVFIDEPRDGMLDLFEKVAAEAAITPWLFGFDLRNVLVGSERKNRISIVDTTTFIELLDSLPIKVDEGPVWTEVLRLARTHALTPYDASYLELAIRQQSTLATRDGALIAAARKLSVPLFELIIPH